MLIFQTSHNLIWEDKEAPPEAGPYKSCTIITTDASNSVKDAHNRMPLILKPEAYDEWLDPKNKEPAKIEEVLKKGYVKVLKRYPVSKLVNQVGNNAKECMRPFKDSGGSESRKQKPKKAKKTLRK